MSSHKPSNASQAARSAAAPTAERSPKPSSPGGLFGSSSRSTAAAGTHGTMARALSSVPSFVWWWVAALALGFFVIHAFRVALDMPTVYVSYETQECVRVENRPGTSARWSCDHLPETYHHVWVY